MGVRKRRRPVPERFVYRVFEGLCPGYHRDNLGAKELHPEDIWPLSVDIHLTHVDHTVKPHFCAHRGGCQTVLTCAGFGNYPRFTHSLCKKGLADHVVHLVGSGVCQTFELYIDTAATYLSCGVFRVEEGGGSANIIPAKTFALVVKRIIPHCSFVGFLQLVERPAQDLCNIAATVFPKVIVIYLHGLPSLVQKGGVILRGLLYPAISLCRLRCLSVQVGTGGLFHRYYQA